MKNLIREMAGLFSGGESFVLATVITRNGSAPRSAGAKMLVRADGSISGTVGGGILEARVQQMAGEIQQQHTAVVRSFQFTGKDASTMDAICGGQVEVLVEWMDAGDPQLAAVVQDLFHSVEGHRNAWLATGLPSEASSPFHAVLHPDGRMTGFLPGSGMQQTIFEIRKPAILAAGQQQMMVEPLDIDGTVYIFGAGHVSRSLAVFTKEVGFWTVVLDDRAEFASPQRFPRADRLVVLDSFADAFSRVQVGIDSSIVVVTRGHLHDRSVLTQALGTNAGYIGMIGSKRKCKLVFDEMRREGVSDEDIRRVHAPIGIEIEAETPEEIGISIVAEMIKTRSSLRG